MGMIGALATRGCQRANHTPSFQPRSGEEPREKAA